MKLIKAMTKLAIVGAIVGFAVKGAQKMSGKVNTAETNEKIDKIIDTKADQIKEVAKDKAHLAVEKVDKGLKEADKTVAKGKEASKKIVENIREKSNESLDSVEEKIDSKS